MKYCEQILDHVRYFYCCHSELVAALHLEKGIISLSAQCKGQPLLSFLFSNAYALHLYVTVQVGIVNCHATSKCTKSWQSDG